MEWRTVTKERDQLLPERAVVTGVLLGLRGTEGMKNALQEWAVKSGKRMGEVIRHGFGELEVEWLHHPDE